MELQSAFYTIGIIVMSLILALLIAIVIAVLVIRSKVNSIHNTIEHKLRFFTGAADTKANVVSKVKRVIKNK